MVAAATPSAERAASFRALERLPCGQHDRGDQPTAGQGRRQEPELVAARRTRLGDHAAQSVRPGAQLAGPEEEHCQLDGQALVGRGNKATAATTPNSAAAGVAAPGPRVTHSSCRATASAPSRMTARVPPGVATADRATNATPTSSEATAATARSRGEADRP